MIRFQADADISQRIVKAIRLREPSIDFASAAESGLKGIPDPLVLEIAATQGRILISHDRRTMIDHFRTRMVEGKTSPGVFLFSQFTPLAAVIDALVMVWSASEPAEWENQLRHLPSLSRHVFSR